MYFYDHWLEQIMLKIQFPMLFVFFYCFNSPLKIDLNAVLRHALTFFVKEIAIFSFKNLNFVNNQTIFPYLPISKFSTRWKDSGGRKRVSMWMSSKSTVDSIFK